MGWVDYWVEMSSPNFFSVEKENLGIIRNFNKNDPQRSVLTSSYI
jgi:hypothetical protein